MATVINNIEQFNGKISSAVTIGTFDGIHFGHQEIIKKLCEISGQRDVKSALITFDPHPQTILNSKHKNYITILTTVEEKTEILSSFSIDYFIIIPFSFEFSKINSSEFIEKYLVNRLGAKEIVIGYDHAFGRDREGSIETLHKLGERYGYNVTVIEPIDYKGEKISSTRIRKVLYDGRITEASEMLGRYYSISGEVIKGKGVGRDINIPTANIKINDERKLIPKNGIYLIRSWVKGNCYNGLLYIGTNPTFNSSQFSIEANIFDFSEDIYGETIEIEFLKRIRDEIKFYNKDALIEQINKDKEEGIKFFNNYKLDEEFYRRN